MPFDWLNQVFNFLGRARYNSTLPNLTNNDTAEAQCDERGLSRVTDEIPTTYVPGGAFASGGVIKSSAGRLVEIFVFNSDSSDRYLMLFDAVALPTDGEVPDFQAVRVPAGGNISITFRSRMSFSTGIYWAVSTTADELTNGGSVFRVDAFRV